jgi:hypothetical protein
MKKARSVLELLIILKKNKQVFRSGLCSLIGDLVEYSDITYNEALKIKKYVLSNCTRNRKYFYSENQVEPFYFPISEWEPRLRWINKHIKKLSTTK